MARSLYRAALVLLVPACTVAFTCTDATIPPAAVAAAPEEQGPDLLEQRSKGALTAPVRVIEMSDFQCPFCRRFAIETWPTIEREYIATGKVRWIFLNLPLTELHPNAVAAAEMAMCSATRGKFWPVHDLLYRNQQTWAPLREPGQYLLTLADSVQVPRDSILPCLRSGQTRALVEQDANTARRIGPTSTPSFLIEGALLSGAYPLEVFRHVLDSIYAVRTANRR